MAAIPGIHPACVSNFYICHANWNVDESLMLSQTPFYMNSLLYSASTSSSPSCCLRLVVIIIIITIVTLLFPCYHFCEFSAFCIDLLRCSGAVRFFTLIYVFILKLQKGLNGFEITHIYGNCDKRNVVRMWMKTRPRLLLTTAGETLQLWLMHWWYCVLFLWGYGNCDGDGGQIGVTSYSLISLHLAAIQGWDVSTVTWQIS